MPKSHLPSRSTSAAAAFTLALAALAPSAVIGTSASAAPLDDTLVTDPASLVNPFVGTLGNPDQAWGGQGNTYPGASAPFGMLMWGPDTPNRPPGGGYYYDSDQLTGFSITHVDGPGCAGLAGDVPFLPVSGAMPADPSAATAPFSHDTESAVPGAYSVTAGDVQVDLTTTERAGIGTFTYPEGDEARMLIKTGGASQLGTETATVEITGDNEISGTVRPGKFCEFVPTYDLHFVIQFDQPFSSFGTWTGTDVADGARTAEGDNSGAFAEFDPANGPVTSRVAISYVDAEGARANLDAEMPGWDAGAVKSATYDAWNEYLGRIQVGGGTLVEQRTFYSSLFRAFRHPNIFQDVDGRYLGFDEEIHTVEPGRDFYTTFSGWDTYRTLHPLVAWVAPDEASDMMQSMVETARQSPTGSLPHWTVANHEGFVMPGDPSAAIIASTYALGAQDFEADVALDQLMAQSDREHNYVSEGNASTVLENTAADFASAQLATALDRPEDYETLMAKARTWVSRFDPATGFIRPATDGFFARDFDPVGEVGMVEGTAHQYRWMLPFAGSALVNGVGGDDATVAALDEFFTELNGGLGTPYAWLGNEPGMASPWMYNHAGAPWGTQDVVNRTRAELYSDAPNGLAGNDDLGSMTSWYVFAALGLYPETPGTGDLALNGPLFPRAVVHRDAGDVQINAPGASVDTPYIDGLTVNGQAHDRSYLPRDTITSAAQLDFQMSSEPNTEWATDPSLRPPSSEDAQTAVAAGITPQAATSTVSPGQTTQWELTVGSLSDGPVSGSWELDIPGLEVSPASGTFELDDATRTQQVTVEVTGGSDVGALPGELRVTPDEGRGFQRALQVQVGELPLGVVDDFEGYGSDASLRAAYSYNNASAEDIALTTDPVGGGEQALRFSYDFTSPDDYGGFGKVFQSPQDWSGFDRVTAWLDPDGSDKKLVFQFTAGGATFEAYPSLAGTEPTELNIPISEFRDKNDPNASPTAEQMASLDNFWVYMNNTGTPSAGDIVLDTIVAKAGISGGLEDSFDSFSTSPDSNTAIGNFAGGGSSYSRDALATEGLVPGEPVTADGVSLTWPALSVGEPDSVRANGQTIALTAPAGATKLGVLGSAAYACNGTTGEATVGYTDGSSETVSLSLGDWTRCGGGAPLMEGNTLVASTDYRNLREGGRDEVSTNLFSHTVAIDGAKQVASLTLPATVSEGQMYIFAIGTSASTPPEYTPTLTAPAGSVEAGADVALTGAGFAPDESVDVVLQGREPVTVTADGDGALTATITVPADAEPGMYDIQATGATSNTPAIVQIEVTTPPVYTPTLTANVSSGQPGDEVTLTGEGFAAGEEIVVTLDSDAVGTATASSEGAFQLGFTLPDLSAGTYAIVATGEVSAIATSIDFVVSDPAPPANPWWQWLQGLHSWLWWFWWLWLHG